MPISPARKAAFEILLRVEQTGAYASELLHASTYSSLSPADHGLTTELVMGTLRWRGVLDDELSKHLRQPIARLDLEVLTSLRLGAYQILFLTRIPPRAAIFESVELVKRARKRSAAGLVNAALRKLQPGITPDPTASNPDWLVQRWISAYGTERAQLICSFNQGRPPVAIRNTSDILDGELSTLRLQPGNLLSSASLVQAGEITQTAAFREHRLIIQDEASQLVALLVGSGSRILDCCAAPGGKTRILARENPGAAVLAIELHPRRAVLLKKLVPGPNVRILAADVRTMPVRILFDRVLVDAPCSGTGTLARNPEIKWRLRPEDLIRLQAYQFEILLAAMTQVAPGGRLIYSTCSLEPEENEQVVEKAVTLNRNFRLVNAGERLLELQSAGELSWKQPDSLVTGPYLRTIPGVHPCDGFFAAILERD
jgi:16S rRNA (cytosine967-C5)-methyltransferase